jgi:hypothetical protein
MLFHLEVVMKVLMALTLMYSAPSFANKCADYFQPRKANSISRSSDAVLLVSEYRSIIQSMAEISPDFKQPVGYSIAIKNRETDEVDHDKKKVYAKADYRYQDPKLNRLAVANTFIHEFGHALFETNLYSMNLGLIVKREQVKEIDRAIAIQRQRLKELVEAGQATRDPIEEKRMFVQANAVLKKIESLEKKGKSDVQKSKLIVALHELFADIVTVVLTGDPQSIAISTAASIKLQSHEMPNDLSLRNFDPDISLRNAWSADKILYYISDSVHVSLSPVRWAFYDRFKGKLTSIDEKRFALKSAFNILSQELNRIDQLSVAQIGSRAFKTETMDALNDRISEAFRLLP